MNTYLTAEVSASAIRTNIALIRQRIGKSTRLCTAVKADCYGHGLPLLSSLLAEQVDCMGVATPEEAITLRQPGYMGPVLLFFSPCALTSGRQLQEALAELIARRIWITIAALDEVPLLSTAARRVGIPADLHIKVDTGMGRSGVLPETVPGLVDMIRSDPHLRIVGIYTHFAVAEEVDKTYTRLQLHRLTSWVNSCRQDETWIVHSANSAATIDLPESHLDMVRPGLAVYGYQPSDEMLTQLPLQPALRLTARVLQVKHLPAGSRIGHGREHHLRSDGRIALVSIGYGDGYARSLSNMAYVRIRGFYAPVRGAMSMDQVAVDVTGVPTACIGDEVEIISPDPLTPNSVESLARLADTIPYEITCRLGPRVQRRLVESFGRRDGAYR